ncbi:MAG: hypothetical protein HKO62_09040, partial [Gammaproteobacteria bacterium]|nr:hypothetical protein [Gammaproteobacteria bacterium]
ATATPTGVNGIRVVPLHSNASEDVLLLRFEAPGQIALDNEGATMEILVIDGEFLLDGEPLGPRFWARRPSGGKRPVLSGKPGQVFVKRRLIG